VTGRHDRPPDATGVLTVCWWRVRLRRTLGATLAALLLAQPAFGAAWQGRVTTVHDGDTLTVQKRTRGVMVRLIHIDAPELDQPFGRESRRHLQQLVRLEQVRVATRGRDKYGRTLGVVTRVRDGLDVNLTQVDRGYAWAYTLGRSAPAFERAQRSARAGRRGLWGDPAPTPPSVWRRSRRSVADGP